MAVDPAGTAAAKKLEQPIVKLIPDITGNPTDMEMFRRYNLHAPGTKRSEAATWRSRNTWTKCVRADQDGH